MLEIKNLSVSVENKEILRNINLTIKTGETHILFGPNGAGKSTLLSAIMGFPKYRITGGKIIFNGQDINLTIKTGETHILFGPNGAGKSTLLSAIMGFPKYRITGGKIIFNGQDIT